MRSARGAGSQGAILPSAARTPWDPAPRTDLWDVSGELPPVCCTNPQLVPTPNPERWESRTHPYTLTPLCPHCPVAARGSFGWLDCGVPSRAQRKGHRRAEEMRREDVTRWRPTPNVGEGLAPSRVSPQGAPLQCRRRPPANHPDVPPPDRGPSSQLSVPHCPTVPKAGRRNAGRPNPQAPKDRTDVVRPPQPLGRVGGRGSG